MFFFCCCQMWHWPMGQLDPFRTVLQSCLSLPCHYFQLSLACFGNVNRPMSHDWFFFFFYRELNSIDLFHCFLLPFLDLREALVRRRNCNLQTENAIKQTQEARFQLKIQVVSFEIWAHKLPFESQLIVFSIYQRREMSDWLQLYRVVVKYSLFVTWNLRIL